MSLKVTGTRPSDDDFTNMMIPAHDRAANVLRRHEYLDRAVFLEVMIDQEEFLAKNLAIILAGHAERGQIPKCGDRCAYCCYQHVKISSTEAFRMALWLQDQPDFAPELRDEIEANAARARPLNNHQRYQMGLPCPMLKDKRCSAYAARPMPCRTYFSLSKFACMRDWERRSKRSIDWNAHGHTIPFLGTPQEAGTAFQLGCDAALWKASGGALQMVQVELAEGIADALAPDAFNRWLDGEKVFRALHPTLSEPRYDVALAAAVKRMTEAAAWDALVP